MSRVPTSADADFVLITVGYNSSTTRAVVDELREQDKKVGMVKIKLVRPFPGSLLEELKEKIAVLNY